eukprot:1324634-Rhodomonas_salina.1
MAFPIIIYLGQKVTDYNLNRHMCTFKTNTGGLQPLLPDTPADLKQVVLDWEGSPRITGEKGEDRSATIVMQLQCENKTLTRTNGSQYCWESFTQCYQTNSTKKDNRVFLNNNTIQTVLAQQSASTITTPALYTCEE